VGRLCALRGRGAGAGGELAAEVAAAVEEALEGACATSAGTSASRPGLVRLLPGLGGDEIPVAAALEALGLQVARPGTRSPSEEQATGGMGRLLEYARLRETGGSARRAGDIAEALYHYGQAAALLPGASSEVFCDLAECHLQRGGSEEALRCAGQAVALEPNGWRGHARRGAALERMLRPVEAAKAYREALKCSGQVGFEESLGLMLQHALRESGGSGQAAGPKRGRGPFDGL